MARPKASAFITGLVISMLFILPLLASACSQALSTMAAAVQVNVVSESNPAVTGAPLTFFATIGAKNETSAPTGTVTFSDGSTKLGTVTLDQNGLATYTTSALSPAPIRLPCLTAEIATFQRVLLRR